MRRLSTQIVGPICHGRQWSQSRSFLTTIPTWNESESTNKPPAPRSRIADSFGDIMIPSARDIKRVTLKPDPAPSRNYQANLGWIQKDNAVKSSLSARLASRSNHAQPDEVRPRVRKEQQWTIQKTEGDTVARRVKMPIEPKEWTSTSNAETSTQEQKPLPDVPRRPSPTTSRSQTQVSKHRDNRRQKTRRRAPHIVAQDQARRLQEASASEAGVEQEHVNAEDISFVPLVVDLEQTNFNTLFGTSQNQPDVKQTATAERIERFLERAGGDYTRYIPPELAVKLGKELDPVQYSQLILGKRRDTGRLQVDSTIATMKDILKTN